MIPLFFIRAGLAWESRRWRSGIHLPRRTNRQERTTPRVRFRRCEAIVFRFYGRTYDFVCRCGWRERGRERARGADETGRRRILFRPGRRRLQQRAGSGPNPLPDPKRVAYYRPTRYRHRESAQRQAGGDDDCYRSGPHFRDMAAIAQTRRAVPGKDERANEADTSCIRQLEPGTDSSRSRQAGASGIGSFGDGHRSGESCFEQC